MDDVSTSRLLETASLKRGAHRSRDDGMCAMELVAFLAGEEHNYAPACASELLTGFTIRINDSMPSSERDALKPFLPGLVGTRSGDNRKRFARMARMLISDLFIPALARRGATVLASRIEERTDAPLAELSSWLHKLDKSDTDIRAGLIMSRDVIKAFGHAVGAAERVRYGKPANWNWCGGELGLAVVAAGSLDDAVGWAAALQILEAGIDACPADGTDVPSPLEDGRELTRAAGYVAI